MVTHIFGTMYYHYNNSPPSQPSPKGEGVKNLSPLGEIRKGVKTNKRNALICVLKLN